MPEEKNPYGKVSRFSITAGTREGQTILEDFSYTSPFKIMQPFPLKGGGIQVMLLAASPGIMAGDLQEFSFHIKEGARTEFISQSYDKIHCMKEGKAGRHTSVFVEKGGTFFFHPQPMIPFKGSAFESTMDIRLEDESSRFFMSEILSCGRYARGEAFAYRFYHNLVRIYRNGKLIYRDNTRYDPVLFSMDSMSPIPIWPVSSLPRRKTPKSSYPRYRSFWILPLIQQAESPVCLRETWPSVFWEDGDRYWKNYLKKSCCAAACKG